MKKLVCLAFAVLFCVSAFYAQEETSEPVDSETSVVYAEDVIEEKTSHSLDWILSFAPAFLLNTGDVKKTAPSPIVYPFSLGVAFPAEAFVSFQPRLSIFTNYLLWYDGDAYPAEIENRTATAFCFLLDFPAVFKYEPSARHLLEGGAGVSFLCRFAKISNGVSGSDEGYSGSASGDVDEINKWFWKDANFLFFMLSASYLFTFSGKIKAGPEFRCYFPCGSLFSGNGMNNAMFAAGVKLRF